MSHFARAFGTSHFFKPARVFRALRGFVRSYAELVILQKAKRRHLSLAAQQPAATPPSNR